MPKAELKTIRVLLNFFILSMSVLLVFAFGEGGLACLVLGFVFGVLWLGVCA